MNFQTPGPIAVKGASRGLFAAPTLRNSDGLIAATRFLGSGIDAQEEHWANAELLAAAYSAFDKAGRKLGVDAVELARSIDLAALIYAAMLATSPTVGGASPQSIARANAETYRAASLALKPLGKVAEKIKLPHF